MNDDTIKWMQLAASLTTVITMFGGMYWLAREVRGKDKVVISSGTRDEVEIMDTLNRQQAAENAKLRLERFEDKLAHQQALETLRAEFKAKIAELAQESSRAYDKSEARIAFLENELKRVSEQLAAALTRIDVLTAELQEANAAKEVKP